MATKIYTDNIPLLDEVVYYLKLIAEQVVLKDDDTADANETLKSRKASDLYILCVENRARLELFDYTKEDLLSVGVLDVNIEKYLQDYKNIPINIQNKLLQILIKRYIDNYEEYNNYYRMLNGKPNIGAEKIKVPERYWSYIKEGYNVDFSKYISDMNEEEQDILYLFNIIEKMQEDYPDHKYLQHLGSRSIDIYSARTANKFGLLYLPGDVPKEIVSRFLDKFELNRVYILKTIYTDAYKFGSDYYDNFIRIMIVVQTMVDIIVELPDFVIKKDLFDTKMVELIFESNGIDYFPEIPFKYQIAMIKNLNRLVKYKSTTKNIIDICSLFGCSNVKIFKYYILREHRIDADGFVFRTKKELDEDGNEVEVEDVEANYQLKFLQVPIDDIADNYLTDKTKYLNYDEVTNSDKYWDGNKSHSEVKKEILKQEFNYLQSKYLGIDTVYSLTNITFQQIYFYNMIFDNVDFEKTLTLTIPSLASTTKFKMTDVICYLFALMYIDLGIKDNLMDTTGQVLVIKGFNFNADLQALGNWVYERGYTLKDLGVSDFKLPEKPVLTYEQLMDIFTKNANIYDHVVKQLRTADNKNIYDIYKKIYDSLMVMDLTMDFFKMSNGEQAKTYTEFLKDRSILLYNSLDEIRSINNKVERNKKITDLIGDIIYILENYLQNKNFPYIFSNLPTVSAESIKSYIFKVIDFFKSYKTQIYSINTIYTFDDKLDCKINIIDGIVGKIYEYAKEDTIELFSKIVKNISVKYGDGLNIKDNLYTSISSEITKYYDEVIKVQENIKAIISSLEKEEREQFMQESVQIISNVFYKTFVDVLDIMYSNIKLSKDDNVIIYDICYRYISTVLDINIDDMIISNEKQILTSILNKEHHYDIFDTIDIATSNE